MFVRSVTFSLLLLAGAISLHGQQPTSTGSGSGSGLAADASGKEIYRVACLTCHGAEGTGSPRELVGFSQELPDFTDCSFATPEPSADWFAVVHEGGPIRGLDRHMPAFGEALSPIEIARVVEYVSSFCTDSAWPRGDLNLPRPLFTEKAYPENELVVSTGFDTDATHVTNHIVYERRLGKRNQFEAVVPFEVAQAAGAPTTGGIGDVSLGAKRTLYASTRSGRILSVGGEIALPTGSSSSDRGNGTLVFEPFAMFGQALGATGFLQTQAGVEFPVDQDKASREAFVRTAVGNSFMQDRGFGRAWTPMMELLWARPESEGSEWDVVPQVQVTLSKLQHVAIAGGVRIPINRRDERHAQVVTYLLWDWFDGSLFDFWK